MILFPPVVPVVAFAAYYYFTVPAKSTPAGSESAARFRSGAVGVTCEQFTLVDDTRNTQAYRKFRGLPKRVLKGEIWRPTEVRRPAPLVVHNHGYLSNRREGLYLSRFLASHGYNVVAVDFPLTCSRAPSGPMFQDIVNQPGDISCVIDYLLARNSDSFDIVYNTIDPQKIAITGLSLGALTSMLASYHRDLRDPRIAAAAFIAGPTTMFTSKFFAGSSLPSLMIYADKDSMVIYEDHARPAQRMMPNSTLVTLKDASHSGFSQQGSTTLRLIKNPDSVGCYMIRRHLGEDAWKMTDYQEMLGGAETGVIDPGHIMPLTRPLIPRAMKASRQHMFTSLAVHAFLDGEFAEDLKVREAARRYLLKTLPSENPTEVSVHR